MALKLIAQPCLVLSFLFIAGSSDTVIYKERSAFPVACRYDNSYSAYKEADFSDTWNRFADGKSKDDWLIVGGRPTDIRHHPYQALILINKSRESKKFTVCGGTIVSQRHILSAAHCFSNKEKDKPVEIIPCHRAIVQVGSSRMARGGKLLRIESICIPVPFVNDETYTHGYDVSIVRTYSAIPLGRSVALAQLPPKTKSKEFEKSAKRRQSCSIVGWGRTEFNGTSAKELHQVDIPLLPLEECKDMVRPYGYILSGDLHICTYLVGKDACLGDSGGGLMCTVNGVESVWGVVSFGRTCAALNEPGIYSRVDKMLKYIENCFEWGKEDYIHGVSSSVSNQRSANKSFNSLNSFSSQLMTYLFIFYLTFFFILA